MKKIAIGKEFGKNGMWYKVIDRNEHYYLAEVYNEKGGCVVSIECGRLLVSEGSGMLALMGQWEHIPGNEQFGRDPHGLELCFPPKDRNKAMDVFSSSAGKKPLKKVKL